MRWVAGFFVFVAGEWLGATIREGVIYGVDRDDHLVYLDGSEIFMGF